MNLFNRRLLAVAAGATLVALSLYVLLVGAVNLLLLHDLTASVDSRLENRLAAIASDPNEIKAPSPAGDPTQPYATPLFLWVYTADGRPLPGLTDPTGRLGQTSSAPSLPSHLRGTGAPRTATVGGELFRLAGERLSLRVATEAGVVAVALRVIVGQTMSQVGAVITGLAVDEAVAAIPLAILVFGGALLVARRAAGPVEAARRRQLAFTADASHELRTPLTVIEAEASLALSRDREPAAYQQSLRRITAEAGRLRRIVEDLLFLARFDSQPPGAAPSAADLAAAAEAAAARFSPLAVGRGLQLSAITEHPAWAAVPAEWCERLLGVLIDNACRYTPAGGRVEVRVVAGDGRVRLSVDDSGPGVHPADRARIFDRFARASPAAGGAGLGLAIGDAVVRASGGRWEVGSSPLGGASFSVSWPAMSRPPLPAPAGGWLPESAHQAQRPPGS